MEYRTHYIPSGSGSGQVCELNCVETTEDEVPVLTPLAMLFGTVGDDYCDSTAIPAVSHTSHGSFVNNAEPASLLVQASILNDDKWKRYQPKKSWTSQGFGDVQSGLKPAENIGESCENIHISPHIRSQLKIRLSRHSSRMSRMTSPYEVASDQLPKTQRKKKEESYADDFTVMTSFNFSLKGTE